MGIPQCLTIMANVSYCVLLSRMFQKTILDDTHAEFKMVIEEVNNGVTTTIEAFAAYVQFPDYAQCKGDV